MQTRLKRCSVDRPRATFIFIHYNTVYNVVGSTTVSTSVLLHQKINSVVVSTTVSTSTYVHRNTILTAKPFGNTVVSSTCGVAHIHKEPVETRWCTLPAILHLSMKDVVGSTTVSASTHIHCNTVYNVVGSTTVSTFTHMHCNIFSPQTRLYTRWC